MNDARQRKTSDEAEDPCPTRPSLLGRLKDWNDQQSWREFFDTYWRLIFNVALRAGLTEAEAQEVVQETVLRVAKKMKKGFQYDPAQGSFKGWLLQQTGWQIAIQFQAFHMSVVQHRSVSEIARFLGISAAQVYLARHHAGRLVQKEVRHLQEGLC